MSQQKTKAAVMSAAVEALATVVAASKIAWPNKTFTPPNGLWASVHYIPSKPSTITCGEGGEEELLGILQIDINIPTNAGEKLQTDALDSLETYFTPGKVFSLAGQSVIFRSCARSNARLSNSSYWLAPLSISFHSRYNRQPLA